MHLFLLTAIFYKFQLSQAKGYVNWSMQHFLTLILPTEVVLSISASLLEPYLKNYWKSCLLQFVFLLNKTYRHITFNVL